MYNETTARLEKYTDYGEFERMGCELLSRLGFRGIEPQGVGKKDGSKDALYHADGKKTVIHFSLRLDWDKKLLEDLISTEKSGFVYNKFVFVSNRIIPPIKRDKFKLRARSKYGWELIVYDQESLRVELDAHSQDIRKKYLGIEEYHKSQAGEIIENIIDNRTTNRGLLGRGVSPRMVLISLPVPIIDNRAKLFDDKMKFIGNEEKLKSYLSKNLPWEEFDYKKTSNAFSTFYIKKPSASGFMALPTFKSDDIFEAKMHKNGVIEIIFDIGNCITSEIITEIMTNLFNTIEKLYEDIVNENEHIIISFNFINASGIIQEKNDNIWYNGEGFYFSHADQNKFKTIKSKEFKDSFIEILNNKINNFFNSKSELQKSDL